MFVVCIIPGVVKPPLAPNARALDPGWPPPAGVIFRRLREGGCPVNIEVRRRPYMTRKLGLTLATALGR
jgi:hypothetical protein